MKILLLFTFLITHFTFFGQIQIGQDINGESAGDSSGWSTSLSGDGNILAIGAHKNDGNGIDTGHVRVYENINNNWVQIGEDIYGKVNQIHFGYYICLSRNGQRLAIGAGRDTSNASVSIFQNNNGTWEQIGESINGEGLFDSTGSTLSLSSDGSTVAIGAWTEIFNGETYGYTRVFKYNGADWLQLGEGIDGETKYDRFGYSVSLSSDGNILAVGANYNDGINGENSGHTRVFEFTNNSWNQIGDDIDGEAEDDLSGIAVSLSDDGSIVAIGAIFNHGNDTDSGHVRIFKNENRSWVQVGNDIDGKAYQDLLGKGLELSSDGSIVAVGARLSSPNGINAAGYASIYKNINDNWIQIGEQINGIGEFNYLGGGSLGLSDDGSIIAVGASGFNGLNGDGSGHVRVFDLSLALSAIQFSLPANNFQISITSESCASMNNGSIIINTEENYDYSATLIGSSLNESTTFNTSTNFQNLEAGNYELCFTVANQTDYEKCFSIQITEPEDLNVVSKINDSGKTVSLSLNGATNYIVNINDTKYTTSDNQISLPLTKIENTISVATDKTCQGIYAETIFITSQKIAAFPNPINEEELTILLPTENLHQEVSLTMFSQNGLRLLEKIFVPDETSVKINMAGLQAGLYTIIITSENQNKISKIIKK